MGLLPEKVVLTGGEAFLTSVISQILVPVSAVISEGEEVHGGLSVQFQREGVIFEGLPDDINLRVRTIRLNHVRQLTPDKKRGLPYREIYPAEPMWVPIDKVTLTLRDVSSDSDLKSGWAQVVYTE